MTGFPLDPPGFGYIAGQVPAVPAVPASLLEDLAKVYEAAHQVRLAELAQLEQALTETVEDAGLTVVRTEPVEQIAGCPCTVRRLAEVLRFWHHPPLTASQFYAMSGLSIVMDPDLPEGEVHLRPQPRPAQCCEMCPCTGSPYEAACSPCCACGRTAGPS